MPARSATGGDSTPTPSTVAAQSLVGVGYLDEGLRVATAVGVDLLDLAAVGIANLVAVRARVEVQDRERPLARHLVCRGSRTTSAASTGCSGPAGARCAREPSSVRRTTRTAAVARTDAARGRGADAGAASTGRVVGAVDSLPARTAGDAAVQTAARVVPQQERRPAEREGDQEYRPAHEESGDGDRGSHHAEQRGQPGDDDLVVHGPPYVAGARKPLAVSSCGSMGPSGLSRVEPGVRPRASSFRRSFETQKRPSLQIAGAPRASMSVASLCDVCERAQAVDFCDRCGAGVCRRHADRDSGLCTDCAAEVGGGQRGAWLR